jgi:hypothetical protein
MRVKIFNGAPLCEQLDFSDSALVDVARCDGFRAGYGHSPSASDEVELKWRHVATKGTRLRTGWSQPYLPGSISHEGGLGYSFSIPNVEEPSILPEGDTTNFNTTLTIGEQPSAADDYVEQSLAFHDTLLSSQVVPDVTADNTVSSSSFLTTSFATTTSGLSSPSPAEGRSLMLQVPSTMTITSLGALPSASHLRSIYPQTPTPNLLCSVMTSPERREIFVRKGGYKMDLWEITVGDDTRSGFKISFWLRPPRGTSAEQASAQTLLLHTMQRIRAGNIVLLRNVALTSFRDTVYGQSLNPAITRARTTVDVVMSDVGVSVEQLGGLPAAVVGMFMRVKRWARTHIATDSVNSRKRKERSTERNNPASRFDTSTRDEGLPPDTMEDL